MNGRRQLGPLTSCAFVVGTMVGTGIYLKPAQVAVLAPRPAHNLALWLVAGCYCLCGAVVYTRLAEVWPKAGGPFVYLRQTYGPWCAALLLAADVFLARPAAVGALAAGLGQIWGLGAEQTLLLALLTVLVLSGVQGLGRKVSGNFQVLLTALQFLPLLLLLIAGLGAPSESATITVVPAVRQGTKWATAFLAILWAYDGWYNVTILAGELESPRTKLRYPLIGGVGFVILLYLALNALLWVKLPYASVVESEIPFLHLLPDMASWLEQWLKLALSLALCATLNGVLVCGPRMISAGVCEGLLPAWWGREPGERSSVVTFTAICLSGLLLGASVTTSFSLFDTLSEFTAVMVILLSALTVTCVFRLPPAEPVVWSTRLAGVTYLAVTLGLAGVLAQERPLLALAGGAAVTLLGTLLWGFRSKGNPES